MDYAIHPHLYKRIEQRNIEFLAVTAAIEFGNTIRAKNSVYYFLGKRAIKKLKKLFIPDNADTWEGTVVVYDPAKRCYITCFKNKNWQKKIRYN